jgi:hypothetical protein
MPSLSRTATALDMASSVERCPGDGALRRPTRSGRGGTLRRGNSWRPGNARSIRRTCRQVPSRTTTRSGGLPASSLLRVSASPGKSSQSPGRPSCPRCPASGRPPQPSSSQLGKRRAAQRAVLLLFRASRVWRTMTKRVRMDSRGISVQMQAPCCSAQCGQRPPPSGAVRDLTEMFPAFPLGPPPGEQLYRTLGRTPHRFREEALGAGMKPSEPISAAGWQMQRPEKGTAPGQPASD